MLENLARKVLDRQLTEQEEVREGQAEQLDLQKNQIEEMRQALKDYQADAEAMRALTKFRPVLTLTALRQLGELTEMDPQYLNLIRRLLAAEGIYTEATEQDRLVSVQESRVLTANDPVTERILTIWTDFGFGLKLDIEPVDEAARPYWTAFWTSVKNKPILAERVIHELSETLLRDGEFLFNFFVSADTGFPIIRVVPTTEIETIVRDPDDSVTPYFYLRRWQTKGGEVDHMYYRDWRIPPGAELPEGIDMDPAIPIAGAGEDEKYTDVLAMHVAFRVRGIGELRGWPLMTTGAAWARAYKQFLENRAAVARAVATYVDKLIMKSGSSALDTMRARFDAALDTTGYYGLTDVPEAASTWLENEAITRSRMPLTTGAGDAQVDGGALLAQAGVAAGIPPHLLGRGEVVRMAVAEQMDLPIYRQFTRYQNFWMSVWQDVATIVLDQQQLYHDVFFTTTDVIVQTDALLNVQLADLATVMTAIGEQMALGLVDVPTAQRIAKELLRSALHIAGIQDASAVLEGEDDEDVPEEEFPVEESGVAGIAKLIAENIKAGKVSDAQLVEWAIGVGYDIGQEEV